MDLKICHLVKDEHHAESGFYWWECACGTEAGGRSKLRNAAHAAFQVHAIKKQSQRKEVVGR